MKTEQICSQLIILYCHEHQHWIRIIVKGAYLSNKTNERTHNKLWNWEIY